MLRFKEDCENVHILRNVLIDTCQVEITGLLQDEDTANNLVRSNKIQTVILPNGRRVFKKGGSVVCKDVTLALYYNGMLQECCCYMPITIGLHCAVIVATIAGDE